MILSRAPLRITLGGGGTDLKSYYSQYTFFLRQFPISVPANNGHRKDKNEQGY
jgi:hypothetical protein